MFLYKYKFPGSGSPIVVTGISTGKSLVQLNSGSAIIVGVNMAPAVKPAVENKLTPKPSSQNKVSLYSYNTVGITVPANPPITKSDRRGNDAQSFSYVF